MGDLISRDAAIDAVGESVADGKGWFSALMNVPSAEKKGKWITLSPRKCLFYCSECRQWGERHWNYCPNCGAQMEREGE